eukprot:scaffold1449_cov244-Pinguiococcus_pyrenoidosus.AAC.13
MAPQMASTQSCRSSSEEACKYRGLTSEKVAPLEGSPGGRISSHAFPFGQPKDELPSLSFFGTQRCAKRRFADVVAPLDRVSLVLGVLLRGCRIRLRGVAHLGVRDPRGSEEEPLPVPPAQGSADAHLVPRPFR